MNTIKFNLYTKYLCDAGQMKLSLVFNVILICIIDNASLESPPLSPREAELMCLMGNIMFDCDVSDISAGIRIVCRCVYCPFAKHLKS